MLKKAGRTTAIGENTTRTVTQRLDRTKPVMLAYVDSYNLGTIASCAHYGNVSWTETLRFTFLAKLFSLEC